MIIQRENESNEATQITSSLQMLSCAYITRKNKLCYDPAGKRPRLDDAGPPTASPGGSSSSPPDVPTFQGMFSDMNVKRNVMHDTNSNVSQTV